MNVSANMLRSHFYVCPVCGNVIHSMGEAVIHCHGILLSPCQAEELNEEHKIFIDAVSSDRIQMIKLYPEGNAEARVKINGVKKIFFYCNRDGVFCVSKISVPSRWRLGTSPD